MCPPEQIYQVNWLVRYNYEKATIRVIQLLHLLKTMVLCGLHQICGAANIDQHWEHLANAARCNKKYSNNGSIAQIKFTMFSAFINAAFSEFYNNWWHKLIREPYRHRTCLLLWLDVEVHISFRVHWTWGNSLYGWFHQHTLLGNIHTIKLNMKSPHRSIQTKWTLMSFFSLMLLCWVAGMQLILHMPTAFLEFPSQTFKHQPRRRLWRISWSLVTRS